MALTKQDREWWATHVEMHESELRWPQFHTDVEQSIARHILAVDARLRALGVEHTAAIEVLAADRAEWEDRTTTIELLVRRCEDARRQWRKAVEAVDAEPSKEASGG